MLFLSICWVAFLLAVAYLKEDGARGLWLGALVFVNVASLILFFF